MIEIRDNNGKTGDWRGKAYSFYEHKACEAYPCHDMGDNDGLNCLFCYCPLYPLGTACGGEFTYTTKGVKDCSHCVLPHIRENYGKINERFEDIVKKMETVHG